MGNVFPTRPRPSGRTLQLLLLPLVLTLGLALPRASADSLPPAPELPTTPLTLDDCVRLAMEHQPSLAAARASLASAETQRRALDNIGVAASLISRDLPIRRRQSCLGVTIANAGLAQAEWETIYAVTRNYFSVIYARAQEKVARNLVDQLKRRQETASTLAKSGDPDARVTRLDVDKLAVNIEFYQLRQIQAAQGVERALAALREAIGVDGHCPLLLAEVPLPLVQENLCCEELVALALARRGELVQAVHAAQVTDLEVCAQGASRGLTARTFAAGADIHAKEIPHAVRNGEYRPGGLGLEMPTTFAGHKHDRMQRARDLSVRASAVVDKTRNLIVLEVEEYYHKWQEATLQIQALANTPAKVDSLVLSSRKRFDSGAVSGEDMLRTETLDAQIQAQLNEALYHHALALAALERVTAGGFCPPFRSVTAVPQP